MTFLLSRPKNLKDELTPIKLYQPVERKILLLVTHAVVIGRTSVHMWRCLPRFWGKDKNHHMVTPLVAGGLWSVIQVCCDTIHKFKQVTQTKKLRAGAKHTNKLDDRRSIRCCNFWKPIEAQMSPWAWVDPTLTKGCQKTVALALDGCTGSS